MTCPGCLEPFGITSPESFEAFRRAGSAEDVPVPKALRDAITHMSIERVPVVTADPAGGYRCPRCGHVVA